MCLQALSPVAHFRSPRTDPQPVRIGGRVSYGGGGGGGTREVVGANRTLDEYDGLSVAVKSAGLVGTTLIVVGM